MSDDTAFVMPEDPDSGLVTLVVSRLMQEPDAVARLRACAALDGTPASLAGRLGWVRQVSVRQLHHDGLSYEQIGKAMGVTKARAYQVDKGRAIDDPAYAWGRLLSVLAYLAYLADRTGKGATQSRGRNLHVGEAGQIVETGLMTTTVRPRTHEAAARYAKRLPSGEVLMRRFSELATDSEALPTGYMNMHQRAQVVLGYHHERNERDALRDEGVR